MGQCTNSIVIDAPAEKVWNRIKNFHDMSWCSGVIQTVEAVGGKTGNAVGARRKLNGVFLETLIEIKEEERTFRYTIDDGPGPVSADALESYVGTVKVFPVTATGGAFVLWTADYRSKNDDAVGEFCNPVYQAILKELAKNI